jgi:glucose-1-phosphate cytidylyltransferase
MVLIGGKPIIWHIMKLYAHHGYRDFVLCLGYRGQVIKEYFLNYEAMNNDFTIHLGTKTRIDYLDTHDEQDFRITLAETGQETMTGGRIKRIKRYIKGDTFMVTYGDGLADVDIGELLKFHRSHGRLATVTAMQPPSRFGMLTIANDGRATRFTEKPQSEGWANAGFFVFNTGVFDYLDSDQSILEREPMERLSADGELMVYCHHGFFLAMDTFREFQLLNALWEQGKPPWKIWA